MRHPGIEPGSQEWESCMIPLHQRRMDVFIGERIYGVLNEICRQIYIDCLITHHIWYSSKLSARLAQSVEHETLNLRVVGSSPTLGVRFFFKNMF